VEGWRDAAEKSCLKDAVGTREKIGRRANLNVFPKNFENIVIELKKKKRKERNRRNEFGRFIYFVRSLTYLEMGAKPFPVGNSKNRLG